MQSSTRLAWGIPIGHRRDLPVMGYLKRFFWGTSIPDREAVLPGVACDCAVWIYLKNHPSLAFAGIPSQIAVREFLFL